MAAHDANRLTPRVCSATTPSAWPAGVIAENKDGQPVIFHSAETGSREGSTATSVDINALASAAAGSQSAKASVSSTGTAGANNGPAQQKQVSPATFVTGAGMANSNSPGSVNNFPQFSNPA